MACNRAKRGARSDVHMRICERVGDCILSCNCECKRARMCCVVHLRCALHDKPNRKTWAHAVAAAATLNLAHANMTNGGHGCRYPPRRQPEYSCLDGQ